MIRSEDDNSASRRCRRNAGEVVHGIANLGPPRTSQSSKCVTVKKYLTKGLAFP